MNPTITIQIPQRDKICLERLAVRYGFSLAEFSRRILSEVFSEIGEESFDEYKNPRTVKASLKRALRDYQAGRVSVRL